MPAEPIISNDEVDLVAYIRLLWRYKYLVAATTIIATALAVYLALTATPIFSASTVVSRVSDMRGGGAGALASQFGGLGNLVGVNLGGNAVDNESQAILKSRRLAEQFIVRHDLLEEMSPGEGEEATLWRAVKRFRELVLSIAEDEAQGVIVVSIDWTDPTTAARWANDYVSLANEIIRDRALKEAELNIEYLSEQVEATNVVEMRRAMYNLIESETKTLMLANARAEYAFATVDPAVAPEVRTSPRRKLMVISGAVIGFVVGLVFVFLLNLFYQVRRAEA